MSTFSKGDSVLGNHSADLANFEATADSSSPLKSLKNTASTTAKRSFFRKQATAVQGGGTQAGFFRAPRILEEENQASLSLRADNGGEAIHNQKVDSSPNALSCHIEPQAKYLLSLRDFALAKSWQSTPPKTQTLESTFSPQANSLSLSSRDFRKEVVAIHSKKVDSSMDCHAIATALARNDKKNAVSKKVDSKSEAQNLKTPAKDSGIFDKTAHKCKSQRLVS